MEPKCEDFRTCLERAEGKKHVLLGNGFSRACRNSIFSYDSLFQAADFQELSENAKNAFNRLATTDFEAVMRSMRHASELVRLYSGDSRDELASRLAADANKLREVLVKTIAGHHPESPDQIDDTEYARCLVFLRNFEKIYTLNYDLLLYWTLMKEEQRALRRDDGFRDPYVGEPEDYHQEDYVEWINSRDQDVHYLHGALHLFHKNACLQKYCWSRTGVKLLAQIDAALKEGNFPLIVAEGSSTQKVDRIHRSNYLGHSFRSFGTATGSLFVYGLSMNETDRHILDQIRRNTSYKQLFVSLYGEIDSPTNKELVQTAMSLATSRRKNRPLEVAFYSAASARVWA